MLYPLFQLLFYFAKSLYIFILNADKTLALNQNIADRLRYEKVSYSICYF